MGVVLSGCVIITSESTTDFDQQMFGSCPHSSNGRLLSLMRAVMDASLVL